MKAYSISDFDAFRLYLIGSVYLNLVIWTFKTDKSKAISKKYDRPLRFCSHSY